MRLQLRCIFEINVYLQIFRLLRYTLIVSAISLAFLGICFISSETIELVNPHSPLGGTVLLGILCVNAAALLALVILVPMCLQALLRSPEHRTGVNVAWVAIGTGALVGIGTWLAKVAANTFLMQSP